MNHHTVFKSFLWPALLLSGMASCSKKLDSAYENPNALKKQPVENIFPGLIGNFVGNFSSAGTGYGLAGDGLLIGRYVQYWNNYTLTSTDNGGTQYDQMGGTIGTSDNLGSVWAAFYYGMGQNVNRAIDWAVEDKKWDYAGGAQAIRAWGWLELANEYADAVIVRQAFDINRQQFDYDSQALAYDSCRAACYKALNYLNTTGGNASAANFAIGDAYFYGGDINKWKKFVYGILARSYAYLSNKSTYQPDSVIKYCDLSIISNADNAMCKFAATGISGTSNYFGPFRNNMANYRQSAYIANLMSGRNTGAFSGVSDPRLWYMLRENSDSTFYGVLPAQEGTNTLASNLRPQNFWGGGFTSTATASNGRYLFRDSSQFPIMTASEILFLKAEAAYRKGDKTTALTAYTSAVSLNFDMLATTYASLIPANKAISTSVRDAFLANTAIVPTAANLTLTHIMLQKYIALFGWGSQETWTDMRRFHYTDPDPVTGAQVYANFIPANGSLYPNNGGSNKYVYRARPRYNSEFIYDIPALTLLGATTANGVQILDYHTKKCWFSEP